MPMFADNFVDELKGRVDLYDLISAYVPLKKSGATTVLKPSSQQRIASIWPSTKRNSRSSLISLFAR